MEFPTRILIGRGVLAKLGDFIEEGGTKKKAVVAAGTKVHEKGSEVVSSSLNGSVEWVKAKPPVGILADVRVIASAPRRLLSSGCGDLVSKMTAVRDWQLAHDVKGEYYGGYAASLALMSASVVLEGSKKIGEFGMDSVRDIVEALISAGVAAGIAGSSRPCSGAEHLFSHYLDLLAPGVGLHGEKCGIGTIMMSKLHGLDWEGVRSALEHVKAPTTASEMDLKEEQVVEALVKASSIRPERYTILSRNKLNREKALRLAKSTGVF